MSLSVIWWVLAGLLVAVELTVGTFYLLMLALGVAAGALAAHAGLAPQLQIATAALVGGVAVFACYLVRRRGPDAPSARADRSVNLDIGGQLQIDDWRPDKTAQVRYRGATWTAVCKDSGVPAPGRYRIVELSGSRLLVVSDAPD